MKNLFNYLPDKKGLSPIDYQRALEKALPEQERRTAEAQRRAEQSRINLEATFDSNVKKLREMGIGEEEIARVEGIIRKTRAHFKI